MNVTGTIFLVSVLEIDKLILAKNVLELKSKLHLISHLLVIQHFAKVNQNNSINN